MTGRPSSQELADRYGLVVSTFRHPDCTQACDYQPCNCGGRIEALAYEATEVHALAARLQATEQALEDIATRQWRDEGGRIAAAIARDGLSALRALEGAAE